MGQINKNVEFNQILLPNAVSLSYIPRIWMGQNLSEHISVADISNFFGSLNLSLKSSLQQVELFPCDQENKPEFNLKKATQWKLAVSRSQRFGLKDSSSFTSNALKMSIRQYSENIPQNSELDKFIFNIAKIALDQDTFADDISLNLFTHQSREYVKIMSKLPENSEVENSEVENSEVGSKDINQEFVIKIWQKITEILSYSNFYLNPIITRGGHICPPHQIMSNLTM